jgi:ABC-2 type transport system permease protein
LLSGIILPLTLAPLWLLDLSKGNPFSYGVDAARALFAGNFGNVAIFEGFIIIGALAVVIFLLALRQLNKMTA